MSALQELLRKAKERAALAQVPPTVVSATPTPIAAAIATVGTPATVGMHGEGITYNKEQQEFITLATTRKSAILVGAAGTGKTTCTRGAITSLIQSGTIPFMTSGHKYLPEGTPGIVLCSFTRRAVGNLRKAMPIDLKGNCITIHKLLEYQPVYYEVFDEVAGEYRKTMRFEATRNSFNPLSSSIRTIVIDESSMVSVELFQEILNALPSLQNVQFIFIGDIQQLPPVFGSAILGYKMLELPCIELTQVYRQALESPIIRLAHRILSGNPIPLEEYTSPEFKVDQKLTIHPWKKRINADNALVTLAGFFKKALDTKAYDPEEDMILIPFNKACGTIELNKHIANHLARTQQRVTHEVIAGFNKHYFSVGDKVLYEREDAEIVGISLNGIYSGANYLPASTTLDYWGYDSGTPGEHTHHLSNEEAHRTIDDILDAMAANVGEDGEERVRQASHVLTLRILETDQEVKVDSAAGINNLLLSYALTVHKSQGSEWRKVFLLLHQSHATMIQRELLYTGVTRAREELYVICEPDTFTKGILNQRIKGNTLAEKAEFFKGAIEKKQSLLSQ
jgi:exodeoxyribonuclease V alpha subunit